VGPEPAAALFGVVAPNRVAVYSCDRAAVGTLPSLSARSAAGVHEGALMPIRFLQRDERVDGDQGCSGTLELNPLGILVRSVEVERLTSKQCRVRCVCRCSPNCGCNTSPPAIVYGASIA
jgi:hypothetical protein